MHDIEGLLEKLNSDKDQSFAILSAIDKSKVSDIIYHEEGVCVLLSDENGYGTYYIVHKNKATLDYFLSVIGKGVELFVANYNESEWEGFEFEWRSVCHQFVYPTKALEECDINGVHFSRLLEKDYSLAHDTYTFGAAISLEDFSEHVKNGFSVAAYDQNEELCGFIGTHSDGSMGMLEVLPKYRRQHIGEELERRLINEIIKSGKTPFCHVVFGNEKSFNLQLKLGGRCCHSLIAFLGLK